MKMTCIKCGNLILATDHDIDGKARIYKCFRCGDVRTVDQLRYYQDMVEDRNLAIEEYKRVLTARVEEYRDQRCMVIHEDQDSGEKNIVFIEGEVITAINDVIGIIQGKDVSGFYSLGGVMNRDEWQPLIDKLTIIRKEIA